MNQIFQEYLDYNPETVINGRINPNGPTTNYVNEKQFEKQNTCNYSSEAISHQVGRTPLSDIFFSNQNIEILQTGMRNMVLNRTNGQYQIGKQSETELKIIMRAMFLQYARYKTYVPVNEQVRELNGHVLNFSVPKIISSLNMKRKYLEDISTMPQPLERAKIMSTKGTKQLELKEF